MTGIRQKSKVWRTQLLLHYKRYDSYTWVQRKWPAVQRVGRQCLNYFALQSAYVLSLTLVTLDSFWGRLLLIFATFVRQAQATLVQLACYQCLQHSPCWVRLDGKAVTISVPLCQTDLQSCTVRANSFRPNHLTAMKLEVFRRTSVVPTRNGPSPFGFGPYLYAD